MLALTGFLRGLQKQTFAQQTNIKPENDVSQGITLPQQRNLTDGGLKLKVALTGIPWVSVTHVVCLLCQFQLFLYKFVPNPIHVVIFCVC